MSLLLPSLMEMQLFFLQVTTTIHLLKEEAIHFQEGGHSSGIVDDPSCLIGTWIVPPDPTLPCPAYGFHLRLVFNTDGTGHATHIDEFLCTPNMQFDFTWALNGGILHLEFDNGSISNTPFSCPASSLTIMWLTSNPKTLQKV